MEFYFPTEQGEQLAFICAAVTAVIGLFIFLFPGPCLRLSAFQIGEVRPEGYGSVRAAGGQYVALGLTPILLAQDWFYMMLGLVLAGSAIGRLASFAFDRGLTVRNIAIFLLQVALSGGPLAYVFGYL
ncbi:DUF4345 domain-containing protein [Neorhizobium alkalisoli]|jgi:hypothetical protein|uniref:DUF4345 domain-containing protein n=1 Tax=Neorhizobium alkalisoli TaxID=528178 RepID=A0A561QIU7_9HYPH|nr:DUF4345 domain-containing protein [Neorhizobium alkalisoli]TWF50279.1 hypothetical protein FHW37_106241 [Neorhizobium alkalisoli]